MARAAIVLAMILVGVVLAFDVAYFLRGSLEEFPTAEDHEKVRSVTAVIAAPLILTEVALWWLLRWLNRGRFEARPADESRSSA